MRYILVSIAIVVLCTVVYAKVDKLQIGVLKRVEDCKKRSKNGDVLDMHYTVNGVLGIDYGYFHLT